MLISMKLAYLFASMALTLPAFTNTTNTKFVDAVIAQPLTIRSPLPTTLAQVRPTAKFDRRGKGLYRNCEFVKTSRSAISQCGNNLR